MIVAFSKTEIWLAFHRRRSVSTESMVDGRIVIVPFALSWIPRYLSSVASGCCWNRSSSSWTKSVHLSWFSCCPEVSPYLWAMFTSCWISSVCRRNTRVSSAYACVWIPWWWRRAKYGWMQTMNSVGARGSPCFTPDRMEVRWESWLLMRRRVWPLFGSRMRSTILDGNSACVRTFRSRR